MGGKKVTFVTDEGVVRICYVCNEQKDINNFAGVGNGAKREYRCLSCNNDRNRIRIADFRTKIHKIKLEAGCTDCGYNANPIALQFDHLPEFEKKFNIGARGSSYPWGVVEQEIAKCEVVCANCHAIRTQRRRGVQTKGHMSLSMGLIADVIFE